MNNITIITNNLSKGQKLKELWNHREVIYFLSWKDIIVRYKQTILGFMWAIMQPVFSMIVMTFVFGRLANLPSNGIPYAILVYSAMLPWNLLTSSFNSASNSLVGNSHLLTKIYFPRLTLPISSVTTSFIDFTISSIVFIVIMIIYKYIPPVRILFFPIFILLVLMISLGMGIFFATLNVRYRDVRYLVPVILQFGMYISPVGYTSEVIPDNLRLLYSLNPMVGIIEGFRWCIIPQAEIHWLSLSISIIFGVAALFLGIKFFAKFENTFADLI